jgi:hypothetical protein
MYHSRFVLRGAQWYFYKALKAHVHGMFMIEGYLERGGGFLSHNILCPKM